MNKAKLSLLLLFGGESTEHEVSIKSAKNVFASLDKNRYDIHLGYISKNGNWWRLVESFEKLEGPALTPNLGQKSFTVNGREVVIDVIFPILHGRHGEDGEVQGLANLLHIPCVGPSLIGAAVSMDKDITKRLLQAEGIPVTPWQVWHASDTAPLYEEVAIKLGQTLFVKPANAGSSIGVSKVIRMEDFEPALKVAAEHDAIVLIERAISGREIELAVLGNGNIRIATQGEIVPESSFYSYDAKYAAASQAHIEIPAKLSETTVLQLKEYAERAYKAVRGKGMARIDFFVTDDDEIFLNEINALPGFTDSSMYPKMWQYDGLEYGVLADRLVELACLT